jgi:broad specificity phosphatase PhoE
MTGYYLTHAEVVIDPTVPVPDWGLSDRGKDRVVAFATKAMWLSRLARLIASPERKAQETAALISRRLGLQVETVVDSGENDRSATGYLRAEAFEAAADAFFAAPDLSYRGWETARAAQARIVAAVNRVTKDLGPDEDLLIVGHGAVGTLLRQAMAGEPISRTGDQMAGGGCLFGFALPFGPASAGWLRVEDCLMHPPALAEPSEKPDRDGRDAM